MRYSQVLLVNLYPGSRSKEVWRQLSWGRLRTHCLWSTVHLDLILKRNTQVTSNRWLSLCSVLIVCDWKPFIRSRITAEQITYQYADACYDHKRSGYEVSIFWEHTSTNFCAEYNKLLKFILFSCGFPDSFVLHNSWFKWGVGIQIGSSP